MKFLSIIKFFLIRKQRFNKLEKDPYIRNKFGFIGGRKIYKNLGENNKITGINYEEE